MARFGCVCGNTLSNSMCPSQNVIYVMTKKRVESALAYNADVTLMDFITNWDVLTNSKRVFISEEYDFWYCTECKRVTKCEIYIGGKGIAVYKPVQNEPIGGAFNISNAEELIVFSNVEEDSAIESNPSISLEKFLESLNNKRYFLSDNRKSVYMYDSILERVSIVYQIEE